MPLKTPPKTMAIIRTYVEKIKELLGVDHPIAQVLQEELDEKTLYLQKGGDEPGRTDTAGNIYIYWGGASTEERENDPCYWLGVMVHEAVHAIMEGRGPRDVAEPYRDLLRAAESNCFEGLIGREPQGDALAMGVALKFDREHCGGHSFHKAHTGIPDRYVECVANQCTLIPREDPTFPGMKYFVTPPPMPLEKPISFPPPPDPPRPTITPDPFPPTLDEDEDLPPLFPPPPPVPKLDPPVVPEVPDDIARLRPRRKK